jgi:hypothetical protein
VRRTRRIVLLTAATAALASSALVVGTGTASADAVFGAGTPGFTVSAADVEPPFTPVLAYTEPFAGEPSIGIDWKTGDALYMASANVLKVHFDSATSGVSWSDASPLFGTTQNLDPILATDPQTGTTIAGGDNTVCSAMYRSTNDGGSWLPTIPCPVVVDHPSIAVAPSATKPGSKVWYFCQQQALDNCATSTDDGVTWLPGVNLSVDCTYQHGHLRGGPDGTAYLPSANCFDADSNNLVGGLRTTDDGATWTGYVIPGADTPSSGFDPAVAVTPDNTLYEAWDTKAGHRPVISVSRDHGSTWSAPVDVSADLATPLVATTFATLTAGDNGRVAYSYLGTPVGQPGVDPFATGFHGVWYLYTSFTYDGGRTWTTVRDTPTPVQYGEIDAGGTTTAGQRNLLDFMDSAMTKDGRVVVAFADGCLSDCEAKGAAGDQAGAEALSTHAWASVAWQSAGQGLLAAYDATPPAAPTLAGSRTAGATSLSWNAPTSANAPVTGYTVLRQVDSGAETAVATTTATSYIDTSAPAGHALTYRVTARNAFGTSPPSNAVALTAAPSVRR